MDKIPDLSSQRCINGISSIEEKSNEMPRDFSKRIKIIKNKNPSQLTISDNHHQQLSQKYLSDQPDTITTSNQTPGDIEFVSLKKNISLESPLSNQPLSSFSKKCTNHNTIDSNKEKKKVVYDSKIQEISNPNIYVSQSLPKCILCNRIYPYNMIISTEKCNHFYCHKCIKQWFFEQLCYKDNETNNIDISFHKCPITFCNECFHDSTITSMLTSIYTASSILKCDFNKATIDESLQIKNKHNKRKTIQYNKNNVIDVNSNLKLFTFIKNNETACPFCFDNRTFNKKSTDFFFCLNCLQSYCKYCKQK